MRAQLLHLSGPLRGRTVTYAGPRVAIGSGPGADARLEADAVEPRHAEIEFHPEECVFYLRPLGGAVFVNGRQVEEVILDAGDVIEVGVGGPKARFRVHVEPGAVCKPVRQMLGDARAVGRSSGALASLQTLFRDLTRHATWKLKVGVPLAAAALLVAASFAAGWLGGTRPVTRLRERDAAFSREIADLRKELDALRGENALRVSKEEVESLRVELAKRAEVVDRMVRENAALQSVLEVYSRSVCLIHGAVEFRKKVDGREETLAGDDGLPLVLEYVGSGFLADAQGNVLTNRHVVAPWWSSSALAPILERGYQPHFARLDACFPGRAPVAIDPGTVRLRTDELDVASLRVAAEGVPVPPLFAGDPRILRGTRVVLLGYPTGIAALLAKAEPSVAKEAVAKSRNTSELIAELARLGAVSPVATQGSLNEVLEKQLIYDAGTTSGGSGGPVFGADGTVIGVNFAVLSGFSGSNFGVPIRYARELLP